MRSAAAFLVVLLMAAGCSSSADKASKSPGTTAPATSPSATSATTPPTTPTRTPSQSRTPTSTGTSTGTPSSTATTCSAHRIPDGTWTGPVRMRVHGQGFSDAEGRGTIRVVVRDGRISDSAWQLRWYSVGHVDTGQAAATVTLHGTVAGTLAGTAVRPMVVSPWTLHGTARITKPVHASSPIDETGHNRVPMHVRAGSCTRLGASFVPSFESKEAQVTFTGTARWTGTRD